MKRVLRTAVAGLVAVAVVYLGACAFMFFKQSSMVYFPEARYDATPDRFGMAYERVTLKTSDGVSLAAWWLPAEGARGAVVFAHGNGGNISHRLDKAMLLRSWGLSVLLFDCRGYGESTGTPTEEGTYSDMIAAVDHVRVERKVPADRIILYGESLGGAVAVDEATRCPAAGLVVDSSFTRMSDVGAYHYPWLPVRLFLKYRYDSLSRIGRVKCPVLVLHSPQDDIIPYRLGRALFEAAREPKRFADLEGGHNDGGLMASAEGQKALLRFLDEVLGNG